MGGVTAAAELELSGEEISRLEAVSRPPLIYPYWHQAKTAGDRLSAADLSLIGPHLTPSDSLSQRARR